MRQAADAREGAGYVLRDEVRGSVQVVQMVRQWRGDIVKKSHAALQLAQAMVLAWARELPQGKVWAHRQAGVCVRMVADKEIQTRKVLLARNSLRSVRFRFTKKYVRDTHVISSREGLESCQDSHDHCASGYENWSGDDYDDGDGGDVRWSGNMHVGDHNDGLDP